MLRIHTTTEHTAGEIHELGLSEVHRLRREMDITKRAIGYNGTLEDFFGYIKSDSQFRYPDTDAGRARCLSDAKTRIENYYKLASKQFLHIPAQPLEVRPVEAFREKVASSVPACLPGTPDGKRSGIVYLNLSDMNQVLKPLLPGLVYHEGAPGHHFQIARQAGETGLPEFRRFLNLTAYTEGWGLYAEGLPAELGLYADPYDYFGRLALEIWRAVRLVVDTGIHAKRWSRDYAINYMTANTLNSDRDIRREVDRYFSDPAQATGYKLGQMKISSLRNRASNALGAKFEIREYHEAVLKNGALPLDKLETEINRFIDTRKA